MGRSSSLQAFTLDDFEARSGSATSILRTIAGLYLRHLPAAPPRTDIVDLTTAAGVNQAAAQTAITRLIDRGLLLPAGSGHLRISDHAQAMFARGNQRIFTPRQMGEGDRWTLVTYSLPETQRPLRHQLRKHFTQLGGGLVSSGLWIFPQYLHAEVLEVLDSLQVRQNTTLFDTDKPHFARSALDSAQEWWDLDRLSSLHRGFIEAVAEMDRISRDPAHSYRCYVRLIDAWRAIPYLDPGLPTSMLPENWPGVHSRELFLTLSDTHRQAARFFVDHRLKLPPG